MKKEKRLKGTDSQISNENLDITYRTEHNLKTCLKLVTKH